MKEMKRKEKNDSEYDVNEGKKREGIRKLEKLKKEGLVAHPRGLESYRLKVK